MMFATLVGTLPHFFNPLQNANVLNVKLAPYFIGQVNIAIVLILAVSAFFTSKLGVKFNDLVNEKTKKILLSLLLLALSMKMFLL